MGQKWKKSQFWAVEKKIDKLLAILDIQASSYSKIDWWCWRHWMKIEKTYSFIYKPDIYLSKGVRFFKKFSFKLCTNSISTLFLKTSARIPKPSAFALGKIWCLSEDFLYMGKKFMAEFFTIVGLKILVVIKSDLNTNFWEILIEIRIGKT